MPYIVIDEFIEKEHDSTHYKKGEVYPKEGFEANPKRVAFLQTDKNKYKKPFLKADEKKQGKSDSKNKGKETADSDSKQDEDEEIKENTSNKE